jgi:Tfp pilus assembly protein FimT
VLRRINNATNQGSKPTAGFSIMELMIVVFITLVVAAMAVPAISTMMTTYRLDTAGHATASLLQQARLQAVRNNAPAYAQYDTTKTPNLVYVNADPSTAYVSGNPDIAIAGSMAFQSANLPDHGQLDAYLANGNPGVTAEIAGVIGFNARGLPCMERNTAAVCQQQDPNTNNTPYFEWFIQSSQGGWVAVTVTPAGRIRAWRMSGGTSCGYPACWQ